MPQEDVAFDVVCYGTISVDNITHVPLLPNPRRDVTANYEYDDVGGEALRVAMPLAQWGLPRPCHRQCDWDGSQGGVHC